MFHGPQLEVKKSIAGRRMRFSRSTGLLKKWGAVVLHCVESQQ